MRILKKKKWIKEQEKTSWSKTVKNFSTRHQTIDKAAQNTLGMVEQPQPNTHPWKKDTQAQHLIHNAETMTEKSLERSHKGKNINSEEARASITSSFSSVPRKTRTAEWNISSIEKKKQHRILYPTKLFFKYKRQIKTCRNKYWPEFVLVKLLWNIGRIFSFFALVKCFREKRNYIDQKLRSPLKFRKRNEWN